MKFEVEARKVKSYNKLRMGQKLCATLSFINILTIYSNYGILNINKYTINLYNLITNLKYPRTSYPRFQFSKHLHLLLSYGHCHLCAACATYGSSGNDTHLYMEIISSLL